MFSLRSVRIRRCCAALVFLCALFTAFSVSANTYATQDQAWAACTGQAQSLEAGLTPAQKASVSYDCELVSSKTYYVVSHQNGGSTPFGLAYQWTTDSPPSDSVCTGSSDVNTSIPKTWSDGKILTGTTMCQNVADLETGATVQCQRTITPVSPPVWNPASQVWQTVVSIGASSTLCGSNGGSNPSGSVYDPTGNVDNSVPPIPDPPVTTAAPMPCGGGSCYDPNTDQYCSTTGGQQICVPGATARNEPGACVSAGNGTICAGSPNAPQPPAPPASPISDPPSMIDNIDKTTQADPTSGANQTVTTVVYSVPGTPVSNGATGGSSSPGSSSSSSAPASSSSTAGKGTASGGGDCSAPPVCTGNQVQCMQVQQAWADRCSQRWDEDANGQPNWTKVSSSDSAPYATTDTPLSSVTGTVGDGRAQGDPGITDLSGLDTSGLGAGNTCPPLPTFTMFGSTITLGDQTFFCNWLSVIRAIVLLAAAFISARVLASGGKS